ncbi:MAG: hypothetical protein HQK60_06275 [Deltaproteobacteria bacterium]|nr:hypothetical protein [Deltaproteobacteria bacterium]
MTYKTKKIIVGVFYWLNLAVFFLGLTCFRETEYVKLKDGLVFFAVHFLILGGTVFWYEYLKYKDRLESLD